MFFIKTNKSGKSMCNIYACINKDTKDVLKFVQIE